MTDSRVPILEKYDILEEIGKGSFSTVFLARNKTNQKEIAIKVIEKKDLDSEEALFVKNEIAILKKMNHPNVIRMADFQETTKKYYIALEIMKGGDLFGRIVERDEFTEEEAAQIIKYLVDAVGYCHSLGIIHRDLKVSSAA